MRERPSSRLLVIDPQGRLLLFRFEHRTGPLAGTTFWATPGGGLDEGESYEEAARRELLEETGLRVDGLNPPIAQRRVEFRAPNGDIIVAEERFFIVNVDSLDVSNVNWTDLERNVMMEHRWWSATELRSTMEQVWPEDLPTMLVMAYASQDPNGSLSR